MFKFKLGDKVRHIDKQIFGEVAGMEYYNDDRVYVVKTDQGLDYFIEGVLEDFGFKSGDVLRVIANKQYLAEFGIPIDLPKIVVANRVTLFQVEGTDGYIYQQDMLELIPQHQLDQSIQGAEVKSAPEPPRASQVSHPSHYTQGGIETIDFIKAKMSHEQFEGYLMGNVIKYLTRYNHKCNAVQDLEKAQLYLKWLVEHVKGE